MASKYKYFYLIHIQFLGFRFHGWQKQPQVKTVQQTLERKLQWILGEQKFKTLSSGRTDSMVSANDFALELFCEEEVDGKVLHTRLNAILPPDIKALSVNTVDKDFQIMGPDKHKEYLYFFAHNEKAHPFSAPFITTMLEELDINKMIIAAKMFEGPHNFKKFCYKPSEDKKFYRTIDVAEIVENDILTANFFPKTSYIFRVRGSGFMRYQIRMMMGFLFNIGLGQKNVKQLSKALSGEDISQQNYIAPASGLILNQLILKGDHLTNVDPEC